MAWRIVCSMVSLVSPGYEGATHGQTGLFGHLHREPGLFRGNRFPDGPQNLHAAGFHAEHHLVATGSFQIVQHVCGHAIHPRETTETNIEIMLAYQIA